MTDYDKIIKSYRRISSGKDLQDYIKVFADELDWESISKHPYFNKVSFSFVRRYIDNWDWVIICKQQKLSENFIREFKNQVDWELISKHQQLSEDFIKEFENLVDWEIISEYQKLSEEFIAEFGENVNIFLVSVCQDCIKKYYSYTAEELLTLSEKGGVYKRIVNFLLEKPNLFYNMLRVQERQFQRQMNETFN